MSEYTPTTEDVRGAYRAWHDGQGDDHALKPTWSAQEFDRWLAAHDAEVRADEAAQWAQAVLVSGLQGERIGAARAGVVAEGPERE